MNLLDTDGSTLKKQYVVDMMRKTKLDNFQEKKNSFISKIVNKKIISIFILSVFVIISPFALIKSNFVVNADHIINNKLDPQVLGASTSFSLTSVVPKTRKSVLSSYQKGDMRFIALRKFLEDNNSPLSPYADVLINSADEAGMDYRLLVGISAVESNLCKVPTQRLDSSLPTNNCWGYGKNGSRFLEFNSFIESIQVVTRGIAKGYGSNPSPKQMQNVYCTSCTGSSWRDQVNDTMNRIDYILKTLNS